MLRALGHPVALLGLLLGFLASVALHLAAQRAAARVLGVRLEPRAQGIAGYLDPFGAVAALLGGPGWGHGVRPTTGSPGRRCAVLLAGPLAVAALAVAALTGYAAAGGDVLPFATPGDVINGFSGPFAQVVLLCLGLEAAAVALLSLVPCPPLTGWWALSTVARPSVNWQRMRLYLQERNIGVVIVLVLVILPIGGGSPLLLRLIDVIVRGVLHAVTGA